MVQQVKIDPMTLLLLFEYIAPSYIERNLSFLEDEETTNCTKIVCKANLKKILYIS